MATKTTRDNIEERQAQIADIRKHAQALLDALDAAESCETPEDFDANIKDALDAIGSARADIKELVA